MSYSVYILFDAPLGIDALAAEIGAALGLSLRVNNEGNGNWYFRKILGVHMMLTVNQCLDTPEACKYRYAVTLESPVASAARTYQFEMTGIVALRLFEWFRDHCRLQLQCLIMTEDRQVLARIRGKQERGKIRMYDDLSEQILDNPNFFMDLYPEKNPWS
jgi:hypothetical protein